MVQYALQNHLTSGAKSHLDYLNMCDNGGCVTFENVR